MIRPREQTLQSVLSGLPPLSRCECLSQHGWRHLHSFFLVLVFLLASSHLVDYGVALTASLTLWPHQIMIQMPHPSLKSPWYYEFGVQLWVNGQDQHEIQCSAVNHG